MDSTSAVVMILHAGLDGKASVPVLKQILYGPTSLGYWRTQVQMVIAIIENRPLDVLMLAGSRVFREGHDKVVAGILLTCAVEMLMNENLTWHIQ